MLHITYRVAGYPSLQVERFASESEANARYDELAGNPDATELSQPFDPSQAPPEPAGSVEISFTIGGDAPPSEEG